jgi:hypothetical protein
MSLDRSGPNHTPGDWRPGKAGGTVVCDTPVNAKDTGHGAVDYYGGHLIAESIWRKADVDLIAAAPKLLAACEVLCTVLESGPQTITQSEIDQIQAAIAKAKGEL